MLDDTGYKGVLNSWLLTGAHLYCNDLIILQMVAVDAGLDAGLTTNTYRKKIIRSRENK